MEKEHCTTRVRLCEDGKYRWTYVLNMFTNPAILVVVLKIVGILFSIPLVIDLIRTAIQDDWKNAWGDNMWTSSLKIWLLFFGLFMGIALLSYLIVALMYRGKYIVHFTMDEGSILHETDPVQARKARNAGLLTAVVGMAARRPSTVGAGLLSASRTTSTTEFPKVRRIKPRRIYHLIKVNHLLERNQVYVPAEDFDFVLAFIREHCPRAK